MTIPKTNEKDIYAGAESTALLEKGRNWSKSFLTMFPKSPRYVKCFLENIEG